MIMIFSNLTLIPIQEYLNYKNVDKIKVLLIELPYSKVTWWIKSLCIRLIITNIALKKYLIYYLDIILVI